MGYPVCNETSEYEPIIEEKLPIGLTVHHLGLILSAAFGLASVILSMYLIWRHATHYLKPYEQKHIIRILFLVPIYSTVSFLSYIFYKHAIYFQTIRDCYEAIAIASFFTLLSNYMAPDLRSQKDYFRTLEPKPWIWPVRWFVGCTGGPTKGLLRTPRSGLTWFNVIWFGIFQYCFVRVFTTIVSCIAQYFHKYCLESESPAFAHIWTQVLVAVGVTFAMFFLIQFYVQLGPDIVEHRPLLKLLSIKLVIFLSFWQTTILSFLTNRNVIKTSSRVADADIRIGIPSLLLCIEMCIFSTLHLFAYPWKPYDVHRSEIVAQEYSVGSVPDESAYQGGRLGYKAYWDAFYMIDLVKGVGRGFRWIFVGRKRREQDSSYRNKIHHTGSASDGNSVGIPGLRNTSASKYSRLDDEAGEDTRPLTSTNQGRRGGGKTHDDIDIDNDDPFSEQPSREEREENGSQTYAASSTRYAPTSAYGGAEQDVGVVDTEYHGGPTGSGPGGAGAASGPVMEGGRF
ncbi:MAG: hypothetical protein MMC33_003976 [Icmadophila ericetorum]|nr:hypothetical protein [Icmadophila ericetorum]